MYIIFLTAVTLQTLQPKLADLLADKIRPFAIALGVPDRAVTKAETNYPKDADHVLTECLRWWLNNSDDISWEAIAKALKTKGVDHKNLADKILHEQSSSSTGELNYSTIDDGIDYYQIT